MAAFEVKVKDAKRLFFAVRGRFLKLQQTIAGEALIAASEPMVAQAQANAPRRTGLLAGRIAPTLGKRRRDFISVHVGPVQLRKREKGFPFYGLFQEKGWRAMGRANRRNFKRFRAIPGRRFLTRAGETTYPQMERIFADKVFKDFAELKEAASASGLIA